MSGSPWPVERPLPHESHWYKSSYSADQGECVEVAWRSGVRAVRDSTRVDEPVLTCSADEWSVFVTGVRWGDL
ncbi:hypothetical protein Sru01_00310 [Sphaerisporangium rufum]|uniref:DUF397 domain-containing protein n=1 Tax=Sphaerisporangium rufum TaxID=1381558 RepID=A0A919QVX1_9ACTN|nr:DUF397 domain-containing protein [Sphaerisporangium rufum]GII75049.1 hypothetical protein Sru01_00310 [Sphaerisporangium rufum]